MKEYYPYTIVPFSVEKIRSEGIPTPKLPKLILLPEPARRKYFGTIVFIISLITFIIFTVFTSKFIVVSYVSFLIALISLVATIFEFVQYSNLKKQYDSDYQLYIEHKEIYKKIKTEQEKVLEQNKNEKLVKEYQKEKVFEFFKTSYDVIIAVHNEYSPAKKRLKLFLEEYFPDEILENVKVVHEAKKLEYVPDFIIKFGNPKLNVAIEIEEPYTLSNIPENIQKDYEAKDRIRQRFANELGWIVIVLSEEQAVKSPTESCKFVEESVELLYGDIKTDLRFANIKTIKKQKMLTGEERANLKTSKYREKYLYESGLLDNTFNIPKNYLETEPEIKEVKVDLNNEIENIKKEETFIEKNEEIAELKIVDSQTTITESIEALKSKELLEIKNGLIISEKINNIELNKAPDEKKIEVENEQLILIKKIAKKAKVVAKEENTAILEQEPIIFKTDDSLEIEVKKDIKEESNVDIISEVETEVMQNNELDIKIEGSLEKEETSVFIDESKSKKEQDILNDLYSALDKHSRKQRERKRSHEIKTHSRVGYNEDELIVEKVTETISNESQKIGVIEKEKVNGLNLQNIENETIDKSELVENKIESVIIAPVEETKIIETMSKEIITTDEHKTIAENQEDLKQTRQGKIDAARLKIEGAVFDKSWDELISLCNAAIDEIPDWDWAYYRRSTAWGNKKDFKNVLEDCNTAISLNSKLADAYYNRGTANFFLGKYIEASEDYQKSIDLHYIKKADAHFNRGLCFQKLDHDKAAYIEFVKAKVLGSAKAVDIIRKQYQKDE